MVSLGLGPNIIDRKLGGPESDTSTNNIPPKPASIIITQKTKFFTIKKIAPKNLPRFDDGIFPPCVSSAAGRVPSRLMRSRPFPHPRGTPPPPTSHPRPQSRRQSESAAQSLATELNIVNVLISCLSLCFHRGILFVFPACQVTIIMFS